MGVLTVVFCTASWSQPQEENSLKTLLKTIRAAIPIGLKNWIVVKNRFVLAFFFRRVTSGLRSDSGKPNQLQNDGSFAATGTTQPLPGSDMQHF